MNRSLIVLGLGCLAAGLLWPWLRHLPLGRLPGDIIIVRENFRLFLPLSSSLLLSLVVTVIVWLLRK